VRVKKERKREEVEEIIFKGSTTEAAQVQVREGSSV
jgi:hypothetical protein